MKTMQTSRKSSIPYDKTTQLQFYAFSIAMKTVGNI